MSSSRLGACAIALIVLVTADPFAADAAKTIPCSSARGERNVCPADTTGGVTLVASTGSGACEMGKSWGFDEKGIWVSEGCSGDFALGAERRKEFGRYDPERGFKVAETARGDLGIRLFTYVRYLNQKGLDPTYTDAFGRTSDVQQRQDIQLNKAQVYFFGWVLSPKLQYLLYVWSANTSQGLSAQVVVAGNVSFTFNEHVTLAGGIGGLPGVRTTEGTFPYWLAVDSRLIGDEFFRPSYTTGIWVRGRIVPKLSYFVMLGDNLSQLGVDAGQLDNGLNTWSGEIDWLPTTGEFGKNEGYGDFEHHAKIASRFALHYTQSDEDRQSQPNTDAFENVQIRLSDGSVIFAPDLFGPGIRVDKVRYRMADFDAGFKWRGYSVEGDFYWRSIDHIEGPGTDGLPFKRLNDHGFQLQASAMPIDRLLQVYVGGSKVYGDYGNPWDFRAGVNVYPWKNRVFRCNAEYIRVERSPVGALSLPYSVGATGNIFHLNAMLWF